MKFCHDLAAHNAIIGEGYLKDWGLSNFFLRKYELMHPKEPIRQLSWDKTTCDVESKGLVAKPLQNIRLQNVRGSWGRAGRRDFPDNPGDFVSLALESEVKRRENVLSGVTVEAFPWI